MQRVAIVGLGLIGGSIGLGLKRWATEQAKGGNAPLQIVGFDTDLDQQSYAKKINAVDKTEWRLPNAIDGADIVILATPVGAMKELMTDIAPHLKEGAIVTDVGSTKADVIQWADEILPPSVSFVGGHPMAGKAISIEGADADLF
jgi:prephenate dehydrogenase